MQSIKIKMFNYLFIWYVCFRCTWEYFTYAMPSWRKETVDSSEDLCVKTEARPSTGCSQIFLQTVTDQLSMIWTYTISYRIGFSAFGMVLLLCHTNGSNTRTIYDIYPIPVYIFSFSSPDADCTIWDVVYRYCRTYLLNRGLNHLCFEYRTQAVL